MRTHTTTPARTHFMRFVPLETVGPTEHQQKASILRAECPTCEKVYAGGAVVTSEPIWSSDRGTHYVVCRFFCDFCSCIIWWECASNARGTVLGERLTKPRRVTSRLAIERFLRANPVAAGVAQS